MKKLLFAISTLCLSISTLTAKAVCPVCTVAVGGGLIFAREFGIDDIISGLWAGALTLSVAMWIANYMKRRGVKASWPYVLDLVGMYALTMSVYALPGIDFGAHTLWGVDKLLLGILTGSVVFWVSVFWYARIKKNNGGHAIFPFQKVVMPIAALSLATLIFWLIVG
ncbi:MAG: hypothetical protein LBB23_03165 [Rickettsiales bacterium]|jgi:hypothetical protein|nr:hypothetical protein [Rickettsiales bacterium]